MFKELLQRLRPSKKIEPDLTCLPDSFIFFDLETTGLKAEVHEVIEVAAIKYTKGSLEQIRFQSLLRIEGKLPKKITEITGISKAMIDAEGGLPSEVWPRFLDFIGGLPLVSYNYAFDGPFLENALARYAGVDRLTNATACALVHARRAWPGLDSYKLGALAKRAGIDAGESHRALSDAKTALVLYCHAAARLQTWR